MSNRKKFGYKSSTISAVQIKNVDHVPATKVVVWHGMKLTVRPLIDLHEVSEIVDQVMSACVDNDSNRLFPELIDFALRVCVITSYADVELPDNLNEQYRLVYSTDLYDTVLNEVNSGQIEAIRTAVFTCINTI